MVHLNECTGDGYIQVFFLDLIKDGQDETWGQPSLLFNSQILKYSHGSQVQRGRLLKIVYIVVFLGRKSTIHGGHRFLLLGKILQASLFAEGLERSSFRRGFLIG